MTEKIKQFQKRNRKRNAHLYQPGQIAGVDYILCPVSNERLSMIKSSYIKNVLGITVEEYDRLYPGVRGVSQARKQNIKKGLHTVDKDTGLTRYEVGQQKARKVLSTSDESGLTGYQKKGQKTRATHMSRVDEHGRNGYSRLASKAIVKGNKTKVKKGLILDPGVRNEFYRYKAIVLYLTTKYKKEITKGYKSGLAGTAGAYHIDHMFSIMHGYEQKVSPLLIGSKENLEMLPWKENVSKHSSSSISLEGLLSATGYTLEQSDQEYAYFLTMINKDMESDAPVSGASLMERYYESNLCG